MLKIRNLFIGFMLFSMLSGKSYSQVLFSDDFNREDGPPGNGWVIECGECVIEDNKLKCTSLPGVVHARILNGSTSWTNYTLEYDWNWASPTHINTAVFFRFIDWSNFYHFDSSNGHFRRYENGICQFDTYYSGGEGHVKIDVNGENIKIYINSSLVLDFDDTGTGLLNGKFGLDAYPDGGGSGGQTVNFDNVLVMAIYTPEPDIAVNPISKDYGNIFIGSSSSQTFVVTNEGDAALNVSSTNILGSGDFSITSGGGSFTLAPAETHNIVVRFSPGYLGIQNDTLRIQSDDPDENPLDVPLTGNGAPIPVPDITVSSSSYDYGDVNVDSCLYHVFTISNTGDGDLYVSSMNIIGSSDFSIISGGGSFTLSLSATHDIQVKFSPSSEGNKNAILRLNNNDPDENPKDVSLSGYGVVYIFYPPQIVRCFPPGGAMSVPRNTWIQFKIEGHELGEEINSATINVTLNDTISLITDGVPQPDSLVTLARNDTGFTVHYTPYQLFNTNSLVTVRVECQDQYNPPNPMDSTYHFTVGNSTVIVTELDTLNESGGIIFDDSTGIELIFPAGALSDSTQIGIGFVNEPPELPDSVAFVGDPYYLWPDGLMTAEPVIIGMSYSQLDLAGLGLIDPGNLKVYCFSTRRGEWINLPIFDIDSQNENIFVNVNEFCYLTYGAHPDSITNVDVENNSAVILNDFKLNNNYPNPFNPETIIEFEVYKVTHIRLEIYNIIGQRIRILSNKVYLPGFYSVVWDARNDQGHIVNTGTYFYIMKSDEYIDKKKAVFIK